MFPRVVTTLALILLSGGGPARPAEDAKLLEDIDTAIDSGVEYILDAVQGPSSWMPGEKFGTGYAALQVYALVKSDVSYLHPVVQKGISVIEGFNFEKVYSVALYLMAYDAMIEQIDADARLGEVRPGGDRAKFLDRMKAAMEWLVAARLKGVGAWNYEPPPPRTNPKDRRYDHSNTQFAVLALGVAAERRLKVPPEVWEEIALHFISVQEKEGGDVSSGPIFKAPEPEGEKDVVRRAAVKQKEESSKRTVARKASPSALEESKVRARGWKYVPEEYEIPGDLGRRRQFSMVCAGVSSLLIAQRNLPGWAGPNGKDLRIALRDGYGWLTNHLEGRRPGQDYYAFYSLEKVGDLGQVESFGSFRWYEECARSILRLQRNDGSFREEYKNDEAAIRSDTALALLFLNRATDLAARMRPLARPTRAGGDGRPGEDGGGQVWIYLPSLKAEVPLGRLFRLLRYRPVKQVLKLAEEAVKVHDPERTDELVRPLLAAWKHSPYTPVQELAKKLLVAATGLDDPEEKPYLAWAERWDEVMRIGKAGDSADAEKLLELLGTVDGTPLKAKVIWALVRTKARSALGPLIDCLEDPDPVLREAAYSAVTFLSGQSLPFHVRGAEKDRAEEVRAWRAWLAAEPSKKG